MTARMSQNWVTQRNHTSVTIRNCEAAIGIYHPGTRKFSLVHLLTSQRYKLNNGNLLQNTPHLYSKAEKQQDNGSTSYPFPLVKPVHIQKPGCIGVWEIYYLAFQVYYYSKTQWKDVEYMPSASRSQLTHILYKMTLDLEHAGAPTVGGWVLTESKAKNKKYKK